MADEEAASRMVPIGTRGGCSEQVPASPSPSPACLRSQLSQPTFRQDKDDHAYCMGDSAAQS